MPVTMKKIDTHRDYLRRLIEARRDACFSSTWDDAIVASRAKIDALLAEWWAQDCKEVDDDGFRWTRGLESQRVIPGVKNSYGYVTPPKSPADKLADAVRVFRRDRCAKPTAGYFLFDALEEYDSTRNAGALPETLTTASIPDPKKIARLLLDSLTGGALSELIIEVNVVMGTLTELGIRVKYDNLKAALRALGEKID